MSTVNQNVDPTLIVEVYSILVPSIFAIFWLIPRPVPASEVVAGSLRIKSEFL